MLLEIVILAKISKHMHTSVVYIHELEAYMGRLLYKAKCIFTKCKSKLLHCMAFVLTRPKRVLQKRILFQALPRSDNKRFLAAKKSKD